jgi:starch phosphorylase
MERVDALTQAIAAYVGRPDAPRAGVDGPVAFLCAEFGVHASLPIYSGGLGVLAGDMLKEASDQALPMVGVGLFYRRGYFRQRIDLAGRQQEQWPASDPKGMPMARVTAPDGAPLLLSAPLDGHDVVFQVWRVDVGRVPLLLLDAELPENDPVQRWTTGRLYDSSRAIRLAQYGLLGMGGARLLAALGIEPAVVHLNEGHPALAALELAAGRVAAGEPLAAALTAVRERVVFTTHTPVPAGNETYTREELLGAFGDLATRLGVDDEGFLDLFRTRPGDTDEPPGMSALALHVAGRANGVSRLHGEVAREMWRPLFGVPAADEVPIAHVTNGVHVPTWVGRPMARVLERHLGPDWLFPGIDPDHWRAVREIPSLELWEARCEARRRLVEFVRTKGEQDLLLRGEDPADVRALGYRIEPDVLTLGFARRLATYKRLHLLIHDVARTHRLLRGERKVQLIVAGKAHPADEGGKQTLQAIFNLRRQNGDALDRIAFVEDYDADIARHLVAGCDVWINLPRRPFEASGTSGMKSALNGGLQLSVLDGWWAEGYDPAAGWAIPGDAAGPEADVDAVDAERFYDLLEHEVIPLFYDRGDEGVPEAWCERMRVSIASYAHAFGATRMLDDYVERMYRRNPST